MLNKSSDLREVLGLTKVPHSTTLCAVARPVGKSSPVAGYVCACEGRKRLK